MNASQRNRRVVRRLAVIAAVSAATAALAGIGALVGHGLTTAVLATFGGRGR